MGLFPSKRHDELMCFLFGLDTPVYPPSRKWEATNTNPSGWLEQEPLFLKV